MKELVILWALASVATPALPAVKAVPPKSALDLLQHPTGGGIPVDVAMGLYVTNFVAIDETRESFEVGGYLTGKWQDPRLAVRIDQTADNNTQQKKTRTFQLEELWTPAIEAANSITHRRNQYSVVSDRNGTVTYVERFDAVLSNDYNLRKFPFDTQILKFEFEPFLSAAADIRFASEPLPSTGISPDRHIDRAAWQLQELQYKLTGDPFFPATHKALFQIVVKRRSGFYLWKIFLPLAMMTLIPTVVFWIDVEQFDWLLKIPIMMLLAMIAFGFTIVRDLPRIGYVTFLDAVLLASFTFCFLCIFEIATVYLLFKRGRKPRAVKLHTAGRWAYPVAYFGVILFLAIGFLA